MKFKEPMCESGWWALTLEGKRQEHLAANCRVCVAKEALVVYILVLWKWTTLAVPNELSHYRIFGIFLSSMHNIYMYGIYDG